MISHKFPIFLPCYNLSVNYEYTEQERKMNPIEMLVLTTIIQAKKHYPTQLLIKSFETLSTKMDIHFDKKLYADMVNELKSRGVLEIEHSAKSVNILECSVKQVKIPLRTMEFYKKQCIISEKKTDIANLFKRYLTDDELQLKKNKEYLLNPEAAYYPISKIPPYTINDDIESILKLYNDKINYLYIKKIDNSKNGYVEEECTISIDDDGKLEISTGIDAWDEHLKECKLDMIKENIINKEFATGKRFQICEWKDLYDKKISLTEEVKTGSEWTVSDGSFYYISDSIKIICGKDFYYNNEDKTITIPMNYPEESYTFFDEDICHKRYKTKVDYAQAGQSLTIPIYVEKSIETNSFVEEVTKKLVASAKNTDSFENLSLISILLYLFKDNENADYALIKILKLNKKMDTLENFTNILPSFLPEKYIKLATDKISELIIFTLDTLEERLEHILKNIREKEKKDSFISRVLDQYSCQEKNISQLNEEICNILKEKKFETLNINSYIKKQLEPSNNFDELELFAIYNLIDRKQVSKAFENKTIVDVFIDNYNDISKELKEEVSSLPIGKAINILLKSIEQVKNNPILLRELNGYFKQINADQQQWLEEKLNCNTFLQLAKICGTYYNKDICIWDTNTLLDSVDKIPVCFKEYSSTRIHIIPEIVFEELAKLEEGDEEKNQLARKVNLKLSDDNKKAYTMTKIGDIDTEIRKYKENHYSTDECIIEYIKLLVESEIGRYCSKIAIFSNDNNLSTQVLTISKKIISIKPLNTDQNNNNKAKPKNKNKKKNKKK